MWTGYQYGIPKTLTSFQPCCGCEKHRIFLFVTEHGGDHAFLMLNLRHGLLLYRGLRLATLPLLQRLSAEDPIPLMLNPG